jgi:hypothetical protein
MVSDDSVSDITVDERFSASSPEPWLAMRFATYVGLDAATNDGNATGLSFDCQIFAS